jgi:hypothetical protein
MIPDRPWSREDVVMIRLAGGLVLLVIALATFGWFFAVQPWQGNAQPPENAQRREGFAADRDRVFDGTRALSYLEEICKIGPRVSGTEGMKKQQQLLKKHFEDLGLRVEFQRFTARQKSQAQPVAMANLIVSFHPERLRRVILCSHYDTRPIADQEPNRERWEQPFLSANDGGSGVALLMELARQIKEMNTSVGIDLVMFDGEEYIFDPLPDHDIYFFGSDHFAREYRQNPPPFRYVAAVLLDMIGGKDARFPVEQGSWFNAGPLARDIWQTAFDLKCTAFQNVLGPEVRDDHLALNRVGIPAVDIIDFNYPHWHRLSDVPANCSGASLAQVAKVLTAWVEKVK